MEKVPVVFSFDDNIVFPAAVCLTSLLENANEDTFYDIFILHNDLCRYPESGYLEKLHTRYRHFSITYRNVGNAFKGAFEIRGITIPAYYRLLIPEIVQEYDKVFYFDVDIIFRTDLSDIYFNTDLSDYYVGGVSTPYSDITDYVNSTIGMQISKYICSGTILINSKAILEDGLIIKFKETASKNWKYQDQDVLNIVCGDKIKILPPWFGMVGTVSEIIADESQRFYSSEEQEFALKYGTLHYNGAKPWFQYCYNFDIWWEYYRKSIYFDSKFYYDFYHSKMNEYDSLSLNRRVRILLRYFKLRIPFLH